MVNELGKSSIWIEIISTIIVYMVVIIIGHYCLKKLMKKLNYDANPFYIPDLINQKDKETFSQKQSGLLGIVERLLYLITFQSGWLAFIGIWISLKTVSQWSKWKEKDGRIFFNNFLIGNGFNLVYAFLGFQAIQFAKFYQKAIVYYHFNFIFVIIFIWLGFVLFPYLVTWLINRLCFNKHKPAKQSEDPSPKEN